MIKCERVPISKDATTDSDKHSVIWWMFVSSTLQASVFMEKNYSDNLHSIKIQNLKTKQMFDISEKLISEQSDEICGVNTINWEDSSWKHLSLVGEKGISLSHTQVSVFSDSVLCLGKMNEKVEKFIRTQLMVSQWNSSGTSSQDSPHCSSATKSKSSCQKWASSQKISLDGSSSCRCSTTHGDLKNNERECELSAQLVVREEFHQEDGHSSDLDKTWVVFYSYWQTTRRMGQSRWIDDDNCLQKADTQFSVLRVHCHEKRSKAKVVEKWRERWKLFFRTIIAVDQLIIYGAVSILCEECKTCHVRTGRLVLARQSNPSFVPSVMKTHTPLTDDLAQEEDLLHVLMQDSWQQLRSDSSSWQKTLKNSHNSQIQWLVVRTRCQEMKNHLTVLEVTTSYLQGKCGVEIRIEYVNKDNSHSWVRISHGLNKLVMDLSNKENDNNEQETSEMKSEEFALKTNVLALASRSKAKAKPQRRISASSSTKTVPIGERTWTDVEPQDYSSIDYPMSKQLSTLLRNGNLPREDDGAIEFWRWKDDLGTILSNLNIGPMNSGRAQWQKAEETRKDFKIVPIHQGKKSTPSSSRSFRTIQSTWKHASCTVSADRVEETSKHGALDRYQTCSKKRIKVLSDAIERHQNLQNTPSLLYQGGNWRNHIRESTCVTLAASEDFL